MAQFIPLTEIVWPYRPDILIRIDFLEWFEENRREFFSDDLMTLSKERIKNNAAFFEEAKKHPYFLNFTRKHRYRKLNLPKTESEEVYSQGIADFINLTTSINRTGYDEKQKIGLRKALFLREPDYGDKIPRRYYIGDGCHRLAAVSWVNRWSVISRRLFKIEWKLFLQPVNSFGILHRLRISDSDDENAFNRFFNSSKPLDWDTVLYWTKNVRLKFKKQSIDDLFDIKFYK